MADKLKIVDVPEQVTTSPWAIFSLISGVLNFVSLPLIGAVLALIFAYSAKSEIRKSSGRIDGEGMANAGLVLGWIGVGMTVLAVCLVVLIALGIFSGIALCGPLWAWSGNL